MEASINFQIVFMQENSTSTEENPTYMKVKPASMQENGSKMEAT